MRTARVLGAMALAAGGLALATPSQAGPGPTPPLEFPTCGVHSFTVPTNVVSIFAQMQGAQGGAGSASVASGGAGGRGGRSAGDITVTPGEVLQINVGCQGADATAGGAGGDSGTGDEAGGGDGGVGAGGSGGGGGGMTDIRRGSTRLLVAGGGGGGGAAELSGSGGTGGAGGGGVDPATAGGDGSGGAAGDCTGAAPGTAGGPGAGTLGCTGAGNDGAGGAGAHGGNGGGTAGTAPTGGGAGGGGYFGGGGAGGNGALDHSTTGGGGGGSGFIHSSVSNGAGEAGVRLGSGRALIDWSVAEAVSTECGTVLVDLVQGQSLQTVTHVPVPSSPTPPAGVAFPCGLLAFTAVAETAGGSVIVQIRLPAGVSVSSYWKLHGTWSQFAGVTFIGNDIYLEIAEGGPGDSDPVPLDGNITDPGGPAIGGTASAPTAVVAQATTTG